MSTRSPAPPAAPESNETEASALPGGAEARASGESRAGGIWARPLLRDVVVGVALGGLLAVSAFTPNEWPPSLLLGGAAAIVYVGWRVARRRFAPARVHQEAVAAPAALSLRVPASVWAALGLLAVALAPTAAWLYRSWTASVWNNAHGILIPPVMGFLGWSVLRRQTDGSPQSSAWGFALLVPGLLLVAVDSALRTHELAALGFVLSLPGLALLLLGKARASRLRVLFLLGLLMVPVPVALAGQIHLKEITATAVGWLLSSLGIPVLVEHTVLQLPSSSFIVADACSGFGALYAAVGLSLVLAASARSHWRKVLLLLAAPCLALLCNIVRVAALVGLAHLFGLGLLETRFHEASGVATFGAVLVLLFWLADRRELRASYL